MLSANRVLVWVRSALTDAHHVGVSWRAAGREQIGGRRKRSSDWTPSKRLLLYLAKTLLPSPRNCAFDARENKAPRNRFWLHGRDACTQASHLKPGACNIKTAAIRLWMSLTPLRLQLHPTGRGGKSSAMMSRLVAAVACSFWSRISNVIWANIHRLWRDPFLCLISQQWWKKRYCVCKWIWAL